MRLAARKWLAAAVLLLGAGGGLVRAQTPELTIVPPAEAPAVPEGAACEIPEVKQPSDLTLFNFFSAGWDEEFTKRQRATGTPDYALLRVQTNFLEREFRLNYFYERNVNSATKKNINDFDGLIAWGFNRRFMIEITGAYQWIDERKGPDLSGGTPGMLARVQLIDTESSSYAANFKVVAPNEGIGTKVTTFSYGLAGFEDLAYWIGVKKTGFYYSFLFDSASGPAAAGATHTDVQYDVTLAKTLVSQDTPFIGGFTVFTELFAQTNLDGDKSGSTLVEVTPGVRFNLGKFEHVHFGKDNWILFGADIPLSGPRPYDVIYRFSYIKNF
jgi:hypothetical protein